LIAFWTILHGLVAIALLGAITHQGLTVWRSPAPARLFIDPLPLGFRRTVYDVDLDPLRGDIRAWCVHLSHVRARR
jgi:hypothetical protein